MAAHEPAPIPAPANNVMLTVRVLARTSETPIEGATVTVVDRSYKTDPAGTCTFPVETGHMTDVDVTASGYLPIGAGGVLSSDERWTFYLAQP